MRAITAAGVHVPRFRLDTGELEKAWDESHTKGVETKAVPSADEDAITMAISAAERALLHSNARPEAITHCCLATTTPPLDEELLTPRIVRALDLPSTVTTTESTQSTCGGSEILDRGLCVDGPALVIAADAPRGDPATVDQTFGAGAVAFLIADVSDAPNSPGVAVIDRASHTDEIPGIRYRPRGGSDVRSLDNTNYERSSITETVVSAVDRLEEPVETVTAATLPQPDGNLPHRLARSLPVGDEAVERGTVADRIGDVGAATVPLGIAAGLSVADERDLTLGVFFASGASATAFLFRGGLRSDVTTRMDGGTAIQYPAYLRKRGYLGEKTVAGGGVHVSLPSWLETLDQRYRLVAGRCPDCGDLSFPPEGACRNCRERVDFEHVALPREGTIAARTVIGQGGAPPEFADQQRQGGPFGVALVDLERDGNVVTIPAQLTDVDLKTVEHGDRVRATVRRIYETEGIPRYGVKFVPVAPSGVVSE